MEDLKAKIDVLIEELKTKFTKPDIQKLDDAMRNELANLLIVLQKVRVLSIKQCHVESQAEGELISAKDKRWFGKQDLKSNEILKEKYQESQEECKTIVTNVEVAISALYDPLNLKLVKKLRRSSEFSIRKLNGTLRGNIGNKLKYFLYESSTTTKVICGLALALPLHIAAPSIVMITLNFNYATLDQLIKTYNKVTPVVSGSPTPVVSGSPTPVVSRNPTPVVSGSPTPVVSRNPTPVVSGSPTPVVSGSPTPVVSIKSELSPEQTRDALTLLLFCAIAGSTGSIVSILTRLDKYDNDDFTDSFLPILIGIFKPTIGAVYGMFVFFLVASNFLPTSINISDEKSPDKRYFSIIAIAFLAGLSERFAKDIVSKTEGRFLTQNAAKDMVTQLTSATTPKITSDETKSADSEFDKSK